MKKPLYIALLLIFTLIMPVNTYAAFPETYQLGLSDAYIKQVTGYHDEKVFPDRTGTIYTYEYRRFGFHGRPKESKPTAQFAVFVNGEKRVVSNADYNLDAPTTVCDVNIDDKIEIKDTSTAYPGCTKHYWDFQYRAMPEAD
ncbi:MAG: hypothetical protein M0P20_02830 [Methanocorpusculum sp.]|nr:hypothetical protein [Methanocorpusculum sp.]